MQGVPYGVDVRSEPEAGQSETALTRVTHDARQTTTKGNMTTQEIELSLDGKVALDLDDGLEQEEWLQVGSQIARVDRGIQWLVGDWINYGVERYNSAVASAADVLSHLSADTIVMYADVAAAFDAERRHTETLEFTHHRIVMSLGRVQQDMLLAEAAKAEYTVREMEQRRNEIRNGIKDAASELSGGPTREELQEKRAADKRRRVEHVRQMHALSRRVKEGANDVRVPREIWFSTILPTFKEPKAEATDV